LIVLPLPLRCLSSPPASHHSYLCLQASQSFLLRLPQSPQQDGLIVSTPSGHTECYASSFLCTSRSHSQSRLAREATVDLEGSDGHVRPHAQGERLKTAVVRTLPLLMGSRSW